MMLIAYWIVIKSFDGIRLVSDVIIYYIWCHIVVPYTEGIGESLKKICKKQGVEM